MIRDGYKDEYDSGRLIAITSDFELVVIHVKQYQLMKIL